MNSEATQLMDSPEKLYTIGTVSKLTGVGAITLRAWERRYDLITPVRKESGHRLYTRKHIDQINRITSLTSQGMRISQIRPDMLEVTNTDSSEEGSRHRDHWDESLDAMIASIVDFDEHRLESVYNQALAIAPIEEVTAKLVQPLLRSLGARWKSGDGSIAEEHFFSFILRNRLGAQFHHRSRRANGPYLLVACLPGEMHEIALQVFALSAHNSGYRILSLGASMPLEEIAYVAEKKKCDAIVLSGSVEPDLQVIEQDLAKLVSQADIPVFVGGQSSVAVCDAINKTGAIALGQDISTGLKRLNDALKTD
ncbi:MAG TPA: MerR family transcriptional regulator [Xanthomonadales bacterium]|nr:MerR family transcriptional regulator [Xanthomonadales bacterium]